MAIETLTYFPAPLKSDQTFKKEHPSLFTSSVSIFAISMLAYDSPKLFLAASAGIVIYQIFHFNRIVHEANASRHQEIRSWAINACHVMLSIGIVFFAGSLSRFWIAYQALRNFEFIHCITHFATGILMGSIAYGLEKFYPSLVHLSKSHRWVAMEDYVENYPSPPKQAILSSYILNPIFFISALLPQTYWGLRFTRYYLLFNQFSSKQAMFQNLEAYFENPDLSKIPQETFSFFIWLIAIHQFQRLEIENQLKLGSHLQRIAKYSTQEQQDQLPGEVKVSILYAQLIEFKSIPFLPEEKSFQDWQAWADKFKALDKEQQTAFGDALYDLLRSHQGDSAVFSVPCPVILAALKAQFRRIAESNQQTRDASIDWADHLFNPSFFRAKK
jgi:uncharacterized membrane protein YgdD (TMEM256/DUF423 family)